MEYMGTLSDMDFCISPPGWGLQWTHRTIEALMRGSMSIIEDPQIYGLELLDGENCIVEIWPGFLNRDPGSISGTSASVKRPREVAAG